MINDGFIKCNICGNEVPMEEITIVSGNGKKYYCVRCVEKHRLKWKALGDYMANLH